MDSLTIITSAASAVASSGVVGALCIIMMQHSLRKERAEFQALGLEVKQLKDNQIKEFKEHIAADQSQKILTTLEKLEDTVTKIDDKLDRYAERSVGQEAQIAGLNQFLNNLNQSFQNHKNDHDLHRGR